MLERRYEAAVQELKEEMKGRIEESKSQCEANIKVRFVPSSCVD